MADQAVKIEPEESTSASPESVDLLLGKEVADRAVKIEPEESSESVYSEKELADPNPKIEPEESTSTSSQFLEKELADPDPKIESEESKLSKRQLRKLKKRQIWEQVRLERRKEERERKRKRKEEALANGQSGPPVRKRIKPDPNRESACKISVVIDMSFDDLMSEKDTKRALTQIQYCYSANRRAKNPMRLFISSFQGKSREIFDKTRGCVNWDEKCIELKKEHFLDVFPEKSNIVYLSAESENVLEKLEDDKIYVIGGLVDHNSHKGLCHRLAEEKGLKHARLPIDEYVVMKTRKVLTINHVFEIMLRYTENGDWEKSFFDVLPKRKEVTKKD